MGNDLSVLDDEALVGRVQEALNGLSVLLERLTTPAEVDDAPPPPPVGDVSPLEGRRYEAVLDDWVNGRQAARAAPKSEAAAPPLNRDGSKVPPPIDAVPALALPDLVKQYYSGVVDEWRTAWRDVVQEHIDARKLQEQREDADTKAEIDLVKSDHDAYLEVAKASLDRAIQRATFVTTIVTGISALYTGVLALVFSLSSTPARPLPSRGLAPVLFLGAALVLSAFYMAFLRARQRRRVLLPSGLGGEVEQQRLATFMEWTFAGVLARAWALRMAVLCLGLGVAILPLPFVNMSDKAGWIWAGIGGAIVMLWGIGEAIVMFSRRQQPYIEEGIPDVVAIH